MHPTQATTAPEQPAQKRGGAPVGSRNAMRHGLRGAGFPVGCRKLETAINRFRRTIEDAVLDARGEITLVDAASVNSAYRWERHATLAQRWLFLHGEEMNHSERLNYSREVARASTERDKAIAALCLPSRPDANVWDILPPPVRNGDIDTGVHERTGVHRQPHRQGTPHKRT